MHAPVMLMFCAVALWKNGWLFAPIPHTFTLSSSVARGAEPWAGIRVEPPNFQRNGGILIHLTTSCEMNRLREYRSIPRSTVCRPAEHAIAAHLAFLARCQLTIRDQLNPALLKDFPCSRQSQHPQLRLTGIAQPGIRNRQIGIVIPGVTDELPRTLRYGFGNGFEQCFVQGPSHLDAQCSVRRCKPFLLHCLAEFSGKPAQHAHLGISRPEIGPSQQLTRPKRSPRTKRIPYCPYTA